MRWMVALALLGRAALADGEKAGEFDYYVLSLSWSPSFCAIEGDARAADQCDAGTGYGWSLHGLWPQYESGYPSYCRTGQRDASRGQTRGMTDIMGSSGLAWHQWKKHGRCSGLSAEAYFDASRNAYESLNRPPVLRKLKDAVRTPPKVIEEAWLQANPNLSPDMITITCRDGYIQEARICLSTELEPIRCGADVRRDCTASSALFPPVR